METKMLEYIKSFIAIFSIIFSVVQFIIYLFIKSIHRENDKTQERLNRIDSRVSECWHELNDCKENCGDKRDKIKEEIRSECRLRHRSKDV